MKGRGDEEEKKKKEEYKGIQRKAKQQQTFWSFQGCLVWSDGGDGGGDVTIVVASVAKSSAVFMVWLLQTPSWLYLSQG